MAKTMIGARGPRTSWVVDSAQSTGAARVPKSEVPSLLLETLDFFHGDEEGMSEPATSLLAGAPRRICRRRRAFDIEAPSAFVESSPEFDSSPQSGEVGLECGVIETVRSLAVLHPCGREDAIGLFDIGVPERPGQALRRAPGDAGQPSPS